MIRILSTVIPARIFALFMSEVVLLFASYLAATYMDPDVGDTGLFLQYDSGWLRIGIVVGCVILGLFFSDLYATVRLRGRLDLFQNLCVVLGIALIGQSLISYLDRELIVPRKVMLIGSVLALAALFAGRILFSAAAQNTVAAARLLFVGMSPTVSKLAAHFDAHPEIGLTSVGYLETAHTPADSSVTPRLGDIENLETVLDECGANSVVIVKREDIRPSWVGEFLTLRFGGVGVEEASALYERTFVRKCVTEIWPSRLVFAGALEPNSTSLSFQAVYSWILACLAIIVTSPLWLAAAAILRLISRDPIIERQLRTGRNGLPFQMYSFRCRAKSGDLTAVGKVLTRLHLDSLPRLFNVLFGHMSIVGPRPHHPLYSSQLGAEIPFYNQRYRVKPGLTGWAVVHGGAEENDTLGELEYDLYYVENLSLALDSLILLLNMKNLWFQDDLTLRT